MPLSDDDFLKIVGEERKRSIGFGEGDSGELTNARIKALEYARGEMNDLAALPNRSKAVDTTVADAVETVLPDVLEVFVGGEDVATFIPTGEDDEDAAQEETDFVNHVVFTENPGFLTLYSAFKDALLTRTGIIHWWWEEAEKKQTRAQVPAEMAQTVQAMAGMQGHELEAEEQDDGSVSLMQTTLHGKVCIRAFPSEDFTCAPDTVNLRDATYCAVRDRPRVQDLICRGIDAEKARALPQYSTRTNGIQQERDEAGESQQTADGASGDLRTVEVRAHYIRLDADESGKLAIWRVVTDSEERVLLDKEEVDHIPFAALTPYINPHRFYGESVADKLMEVQRLKTAVLRGHMDQIYFALNQRIEVDMTKANEFTVADLLRNEPGVPVRSKGNALAPIEAGRLNVDTLATLEYIATIAESRSGIVRNAQGLNPDTLHDTAQGALALISAAQKRVRLIARIFAETGIKDLFLGVHNLLRTAQTAEHAPMNAKLGKSWKQVKPNDWPERTAMAVHVGVGSAGREHDMMIATKRLELMQQVAMDPNLQGTVLDPKNIHQALTGWERAAGTKNPDAYWSDPSSPQAVQAAQQKAQQPNPAMAEVQGKLQIEQARVQAKAHGDMQSAQMDMQLQQAKHQAQMQQDAAHASQQLQLQREKMAQEHEQKMYQISQELELRREIAAEELNLKRQVAMAQAHSSHELGMAKVQAGSVQEPQAGGEPG